MVVTPLDIVVQTYGAPSTGIKMFIIIAACALFLVALIFYYLSRLYHGKERFSQIPSKSVYVPLEQNDLPPDVLKFVDNRLKNCVGDIKVRAGPLHGKESCFNYPGMSPPDYIQEHNMQMGYGDQGTLFPPNCVYEDIIDSLALKQRFDGALLTNFQIPPSFTFREVIIFMYHRMSDLAQRQQETILVMRNIIDLYEKFRFGPDLIAENDLVVFLLALEVFLSNFMLLEHVLNTHQSMYFDNGLIYGWKGSLRSGIFDDEHRGDVESLFIPNFPSAVSRATTRQSGISAQSVSTDGLNPRRRSSTGSVIKSRLEYRKPRSLKYLGESSEVLLRAPSGYVTDSEDDHDTTAT